SGGGGPSPAPRRRGWPSSNYHLVQDLRERFTEMLTAKRKYGLWSRATPRQTSLQPGSGLRGALRPPREGGVSEDRPTRFDPAPLRQVREAAGLSTRAFARQLDCSGPYIQFIEFGRARPSVEFLEGVAARFPLDLRALWVTGRRRRAASHHGASVPCSS